MSKWADSVCFGALTNRYLTIAGRSVRDPLQPPATGSRGAPIPDEADILQWHGLSPASRHRSGRSRRAQRLPGVLEGNGRERVDDTDTSSRPHRARSGTPPSRPKPHPVRQRRHSPTPARPERPMARRIPRRRYLAAMPSVLKDISACGNCCIVLWNHSWLKEGIKIDLFSMLCFAANCFTVNGARDRWVHSRNHMAAFLKISTWENPLQLKRS